MNDIKLRVEDEINHALDKLNEFDPTTQEYETICKNLEQLCQTKNTLNFYPEDNTQNKDKIIEYSFKAAELLVPIMFYGAWMRRGLEFEKNGSFTSTTFKNFINKFKI